MFYRCDPKKNYKCQKTTCFLWGGSCSITSDERCKCDGTEGIQDIAGNKLIAAQAEMLKEVTQWPALM